MAHGGVLGGFKRFWRLTSLQNSLLVGRPGLDPGTLGSKTDHPSASVAIQISWSDASTSPPSSEEVLSNLGLRLQKWLHELGSGVIGVMRFENADGASFELRVES